MDKRKLKRFIKEQILKEYNAALEEVDDEDIAFDDIVFDEDVDVLDKIVIKNNAALTDVYRLIFEERLDVDAAIDGYLDCGKSIIIGLRIRVPGGRVWKFVHQQKHISTDDIRLFIDSVDRRADIDRVIWKLVLQNKVDVVVAREYEIIACDYEDNNDNIVAYIITEESRKKFLSVIAEWINLLPPSEHAEVKKQI